MCTSYHISFRSGRRVIKILSPHLPFLYPRKDLAVPSYWVTCFSSYDMVYCTSSSDTTHHNIITPLHVLPPLPSFSISAATSRQLPLAIAASKPRHYLRLLSVPPVPGSLSTAAASQHRPPLPTTPTCRIKPLPPKMKTAAYAPKRAKIKEVCVHL